MDKNKLSTYVENIKKNVFNNWVDVKGSAKVVYERTVSKTKRFFDITYLVFTLISYISFVFYAGTIIKNYGFEDWISIVFLVVLCIYTVVLDENNESTIKEWHTFLDSAGTRYKEELDQMKREGDLQGTHYDSIKDKIRFIKLKMSLIPFNTKNCSNL